MEVIPKKGVDIMTPGDYLRLHKLLPGLDALLEGKRSGRGDGKCVGRGAGRGNPLLVVAHDEDE